MELLDGKRIVVTGSSRGLGRAFALALAQHGARLVVNGTDPAKVADVQRECAAAGAGVVGVAGSVADDELCERLIATCVDRFGGIDVAICNAGVARDRTLLKATPDEFDETIAVNLRGAWSVCRHAARAMREGGGLLLLVTSAAAFTGSVGQSAYAASKAGMMGLLYAWDLELARYGIRVNAVVGSAVTDLTAERFEVARRRAEAADHPPPTPRQLGFGLPEEVAPLVVYLCSEQAAHVRSQLLRFNGHRLVLWRHPAEAVSVEREQWTVDDIAEHLPTRQEAVWEPLG